MIVFYTGPKKWKGPLTLSDYLDIPEELKEYVNDWKIKAVDVIPHSFLYTSLGWLLVCSSLILLVSISLTSTNINFHSFIYAFNSSGISK